MKEISAKIKLKRSPVPQGKTNVVQIAMYPHMGAAEISAGGTKTFFQGGGPFSKLRVWVGSGFKFFFRNCHVGGGNI